MRNTRKRLPCERLRSEYDFSQYRQKHHGPAEPPQSRKCSRMSLASAMPLQWGDTSCHVSAT